MNSSDAPALAAAFREFAAAQTFDFEPATLYDPVRYAMATPGKGVRPLLLLQAHALGNPNFAPALPAAYAVELFHSFTLVHDDIMDAADTRRGRPTVHEAFGTSTAILAGDAMLIQSYGYLLDHYSGELGARLLQVFSAMAKALCSGQQRDMDMEADAGAGFTFTDYLAMIAGKTGALITASLELGGIIADLGEEDLARLRKGGDLAGRAFQILDDVLDTFSTGALTGKMDHGDIRRGKLSAPYLRALDRASTADANRLKAIYAMPVAEREALVPEVLRLFAASQVEESLRDEASALTEAALREFDELGGRLEAKAELRQTISLLLARAY